MPWSPPMMLVSSVGQAIFQTTGVSGPSTMERSKGRPARRSGLAETGEVNHEPVPHVAPEHPLVRLVDPLDRDLLHVGGDPFPAAEVEHLLGLPDSADHRAGEPAAPRDEGTGLERG